MDFCTLIAAEIDQTHDPIKRGVLVLAKRVVCGPDDGGVSTQDSGGGVGGNPPEPPKKRP